MQVPLQVHDAHPWRVHELASDFRLLDVWRYPLQLDASVRFEEFVSFLEGSQQRLVEGRGPAAWLFWLRGRLGEWFGWDQAGEPLPIPGCQETSVRDRMPEAAVEPGLEGAKAMLAFTPVYRRADEMLLEISNGTVHALMHLGRFPLDGAAASQTGASPGRWAPQMAVYVKERGLLGRVYMAVIAPFRHWVVYPAMMRGVAQGWQRHRAGEAALSG